MKEGFEIPKDRRALRITITRDSVCAADDINAPHKKNVSSYSFLDPGVLAQQLTSRYPLPQIAGGKATWLCRLNGEAIAVVAQQWASPRSLKKRIQFLKENQVHFEYCAQKEPEEFLK